MATKEETIITLSKTLENISQMMVSVVDNQNNSWKYLNEKQIELLTYQCQTTNRLVSEMLEELKKGENN